MYLVKNLSEERRHLYTEKCKILMNEKERKGKANGVHS